MDNTPLPNAILILLSIHERPDQRIQHRHQLHAESTIQWNDRIHRKRCTGYAGVLLHNMPIQSFGRRVDRTDCFSTSECWPSAECIKEKPNSPSPTRWYVNNSLPTFWILIMKTTWLSTVMKRGSLSQGWLMMANGNLTLNTLPDACTVMPRSRPSRKVNILFMVLLLP